MNKIAVFFMEDQFNSITGKFGVWVEGKAVKQVGYLTLVVNLSCATHDQLLGTSGGWYKTKRLLFPDDM